MTFEEYQFIRDFIHDKSLRLMINQNKNYATTGFPIENYTSLNIKGNNYYIVKTNPFKLIVDEVLIEASEKSPDKFGTGCAKDVLDAIFKIDSASFSLEKFINFLQTEQFCYVVEKTKEGLTDRILRIDLFRQLKVNDIGKFDFVGGLFHTMKHFSYKGKPLSTGNEKNDIPYIEHLIVSITQAFFSPKLKLKEKQNYTSFLKIDSEYNLRVEFYYEEKTNVYFINTAFKEKNIF